MTVGVIGRGALGTLFERALSCVVEVRTVGRGDDVAPLAGVAWLFLAVKTFATVSALAPLRDVLAPDAVVVSLQNGMDQTAHVAAALGAERDVVLAPTSEGATRLADGSVHRAGIGLTRLGRPRGRSGPPLEPLAALLRSAGFPAEVAEPIEPWLWAKLVANAAINPLTALANVPNGALFDDPSRAVRVERLAREVAAVAEAEGVSLPFGDPVAYVRDIARATAANRSSMLQDLTSGRPTEIDAINGAVVRMAARHGLAVPENLKVRDEVRARTTA